MIVRRCTRLDDHDQHEWWAKWITLGRVGRQRYLCLGHTVVEGGHRAHAGADDGH